MHVVGKWLWILDPSRSLTEISSSVLERECPGRLHTVDRKAEAPSPVAEVILMAVLGGTIDSRLVNLASLSSRCRLF